MIGPTQQLSTPALGHTVMAWLVAILVCLLLYLAEGSILALFIVRVVKPLVAPFIR